MKIFTKESSCVDNLRRAILNKRHAVILEFAVGLGVFCDLGGAAMHDKKVLRAMYADIDYDCLRRSGDDYVAIDNRIRAIAGLYEKLGQRTITKWAKGKTDEEALESITKELDNLRLYTLDSVFQFCRPDDLQKEGERRARRQWTADDHPKRRQEDTDYAYVVEIPHVKVGVAPDATYSELKKAADKLMELANKKKYERGHLKAA